jgi:hypothetical protein
MDDLALERFGVSKGRASGIMPDVPPHLSDAEERAFIRCWNDAVWLEQERIPLSEIVSALRIGHT